MASNWAAGLPRWQPHYDDNGQVYGLAHLHPKRFTLNFTALRHYPARAVEIRVGYASHAFTIKCPENRVPHLHYSKVHDPRVFCLNRYQLSIALPALIEGLEARKCYATNHKNYFIVERLPDLPIANAYLVFFNLARCEKPDALRVFVESAYSSETGRIPHGRDRKGDGFRALVSKALGLNRSPP